MGLTPSNPISPKGAAKPTHCSLGLTVSPLPPRGNAANDEPSRMLHALCMCVLQWVGPPAAPTVVGGGAGAAPGCVEVMWRCCFMSSIHPKVGMAVLIGARVKAKVRALARRDAHSFLAVWAIFGIIALRCGNRCCDFFFTGWPY